MRSSLRVRAMASRTACWRSGSRPSRLPLWRSGAPLRCNSAVSRAMERARIWRMPSTSSLGRRQFSVEKAQSVRYLMPSSAAWVVTRRMFSVPASWPAMRGRPRRVAQRPLPSMMMATWRGTTRSGDADAAGSVVGATAAPLSDFEDLGLFVLANLVRLVDVAVGELLDLLLGAALIVFADELLLEHLLDLCQGIAPDVPDRDAALLHLLPHNPDQSLATLFG